MEPAKKAQSWSFAIYYDQDYTLEQIGFIKFNEDRNYTMGLGILASGQYMKKWFVFAPHYLLNNLFNKPYLNDKNSKQPENRTAMMIGNGSFTPEYLPAATVIENDRPYSSLTYLQTITSHVDYDKFIQSISTFSTGVLGTGISKSIQTRIHEAMNENDTKNPRTPRGWHNQISNGGELTLNYTFEKERLLTRKAVSEEIKTSVGGIEFKYSYGYSVGYYTNAMAGIHFRLGQKDPRDWTYRVNPLGSSNKADAGPVDYYARKKTWQVYLFGSVQPYFILYNALLNGQFRRSAHTINFQDTRHLILEANGGGAIHIPFGLTAAALKLHIKARSPEFKMPGRPARWHYWGTIELIIQHL